MLYTRIVLASVWLVVLGFALSGSGAGTGLSLLVVAGLATPAILLTIGAKRWKVASAPATIDPEALRLSDAQDLLRMDSDKG